jgi:hypothetical protein
MLSSLTLQHLTFCLRFVFSNWPVLLRLSDQWFLFSVSPIRATLFCSVFSLLTSKSSYILRAPCVSRALASKYIVVWLTYLRAPTILLQAPGCPRACGLPEHFLPWFSLQLLAQIGGDWGRFPAEVEIFLFSSFQTRCGAHPASYQVGTVDVT